MKHSTAAHALIYCVLALSLPGQPIGYSTFLVRNYEPPVVDAPVFDSQGVALGSYYSAELWGAATPESLVPAIDFATHARAFVPFLDELPGYFLSDRSLISVPATSNGGSAWLQVRVWDARLGDSYEQVASLGLGGYGESALIYADGGNPFGSPELPGLLLGLESFRLRPVVPEPSTWALLAVGGLALTCAARRRRRRSSENLSGLRPAPRRSPSK